MRILEFKGDFFEIGRQEGALYRKRGIKFKNKRIDRELFDNQLKAYARYYPEFLEEIAGVADGGKFDMEELTYSHICGELLYVRNILGDKRQCTIFGIKNKNGAFVGRNYDWYPAAEKVFSVYRVKNIKRKRFLGVSDMLFEPSRGKNGLFFEPEDAINEEGLFLGLTFAYRDACGYGLGTTHVIKLIAETCSTVEEAISLFGRIKLCCPKNFFLSDKAGNMAIVEHAYDRFRVIYPRNGVLVQTNHYTDRVLRKYDTVLLHQPRHNTFLRYDETLGKINASQKTFRRTDVIDVLGKPGSYTCQNSGVTKTIWSLALDMKKRKYTIYWNLLQKRREMSLKV